MVSFANEKEFEAHIRALILKNITSRFPDIYALENKKAVDILLCKDKPEPKLFFIEVKYHKSSHGRLGFGSSGGGGFQPEILQKQPLYFEQNLKWIIGDEKEKKGKVLFLSSNIIRQYISGGEIANKFNNIQKRIFREEHWLDEVEFVDELEQWLTT